MEQKKARIKKERGTGERCSQMCKNRPMKMLNMMQLYPHRSSKSISQVKSMNWVVYNSMMQHHMTGKLCRVAPQMQAAAPSTSHEPTTGPERAGRIAH